MLLILHCNSVFVYLILMDLWIANLHRYCKPHQMQLSLCSKDVCLSAAFRDHNFPERDFSLPSTPTNRASSGQNVYLCLCVLMCTVCLTRFTLKLERQMIFSPIPEEGWTWKVKWSQSVIKYIIWPKVCERLTITRITQLFLQYVCVVLHSIPTNTWWRPALLTSVTDAKI